MNEAIKWDEHALAQAETTRTDFHPHCRTCSLAEHCLPSRISHEAMQSTHIALHALVHDQHFPAAKKQYLYHQNDPFRSLYIVREGAVKTLLLDASGCEQISGFYYPGDMIGLDGIHTNHYATTAVTLSDTRVCAIDFAQLETISTLIPSLQHHVFTIMAKEIERHQRMMALLSHKSAEQKLAHLLIRYGLHRYRLNQSTQRFTLPMSRRDMSNHLGLAVETVSRLLSRFQQQGLLQISGREVSAFKLAAMQELFENGH